MHKKPPKLTRCSVSVPRCERVPGRSALCRSCWVLQQLCQPWLGEGGSDIPSSAHSPAPGVSPSLDQLSFRQTSLLQAIRGEVRKEAQC